MFSEDIQASDLDVWVSPPLTVFAILLFEKANIKVSQCSKLLHKLFCSLSSEMELHIEPVDGHHESYVMLLLLSGASLLRTGALVIRCSGLCLLECSLFQRTFR